VIVIDTDPLASTEAGGALVGRGGAGGAADVHALMAATGPAVKLLLDTGHATFAGADPVRWRGVTAIASGMSTARTSARR
jgi:hypothetical protein